MPKRGKKYEEKNKQIEKTLYSLPEAIIKAKQGSYTKFEGSVDLHLSLNLPSDKEPKSIKGTLSLPNTVKKKDLKAIVFCEKENTKKAKDAGAVEAGLEDLIKKIQDGWSDFDIAIAVPSVMSKIAVLGKDLGPKGLMPNPKTGTLREDFEKALGEFKKGKTKWACDESRSVHIPVGKTKMDDKKIQKNILYSVKQIAQTIGRPINTLVKGASLAPTMGPSAKIKIEELE